jgi:hypothetical protein
MTQSSDLVQAYHARNEIFRSNHVDMISSKSVIWTCTVMDLGEWVTYAHGIEQRRGFGQGRDDAAQASDAGNGQVIPGDTATTSGQKNVESKASGRKAQKRDENAMPSTSRKQRRTAKQGDDARESRASSSEESGDGDDDSDSEDEDRPDAVYMCRCACLPQLHHQHKHRGGCAESPLACSLLCVLALQTPACASSALRPCMQARV